MTFSPAAPRNTPLARAVTRAKSTLAAPIIDFCTVVIPAEGLKAKFDLVNVRTGELEHRHLQLRELLHWIFSTGEKLAMGPLLDRSWNFFPQSSTLVDATGSVAGKVGVAADGNVCFSLSGQGCSHVGNWRLVESRLRDLGAHLTRLDIAVDDLTGETFKVADFKRAYEAGEFVMNGRPPQSQFVDDMGSGKGCTLYIGQKGHKQLCIYEKGKQLGDPESDHTRCELRLYAKRMDLPLEALSDPGRFFGAAYPILVQFVIGECERLHVRERMVNASVVALKNFLRNQAGTGLHLVLDALGEDAWSYIVEHIARPGRPARFKSYTGDLPALIRTELTRG